MMDVTGRGRMTRRSFMTAAGGLALGIGVASLATAAPAEAVTTQASWYWCHYCDGLWHNGTNDGFCFGNGTHSSSGSDQYEIHTTSDTGYRGQSAWYWCAYCGLLRWNGNPGVCAGNDLGPHTTSGSSNYRIAYVGNSNAASPYQSGWRYCNSCGILLWGNHADDTPCAGTFAVGHTVVGSTYILEFA